MDNSREIISRKSDKDLAPGSKVVLGFSGGLDTTFCVKHFEEHCFLINRFQLLLKTILIMD